VQSDAIFQIGSVPGRAVTRGSAVLEEMQHFALKVRFADGMLCDQPGRSIFACYVLSGPAVLCNQLSQPCGILAMDGLHARNIGTAELAGIEKFLAHTQVFRAHFKQFAPEILVDHRIHSTGGYFRLQPTTQDTGLDMFYISSIIEI
jgi:hypothetical protein